MRQGRNGFGLVAAWLLLLAAPAALPAEEPAARLAANRALVLRYVEEVLSRGQLDHLEQMVSPGYTDSSPGAQDPERGPALVRAAQKRVRSLFPSISYQIDQLIAEDDKVVARYTVQATYQPREEGREPGPGTDALISGMTIFRISRGLIAESWTINDQLGLFTQIGFTLTPPPAAEAPAAPSKRLDPKGPGGPR